MLLALGASGTLGCSRPKPRAGAPAAKAVASSAAARASGRAEPSALELCSALHRKPAERRAACCSEPLRDLYFDECVRHLSEAVRAGRAGIEVAKVAACAARVDANTRGCGWIAPARPDAPVECAGAVLGKVPAGGRCASSLECAGDLHCAGQGATSPGVCRPPQPAGEACGISIDTLATYLGVRGVERRKPACAEHCALATRRCEPEPAVGAACRAGVNCGTGQVCDEGRCQVAPRAPSASDEPRASCRTDRDCASGGCVAPASGPRRCGMKCRLDLASLTAEPELDSLALERR